MNKTLLFAIFALALLTGCTGVSDDFAADSYGEEGDEMKLNITFDGQDASDDITRALVASSEDVYIHSYSLGKRVANNIRYTIRDGKWQAYSTKLKWPNNKDQLVNLFGLSESFKGILEDNAKEGYIQYEVRTENPNDVFFGSALNTSSNKSGGVVNMNFTRLVSRVHFYCKNSMDNAQLVIHKLKLHNLVSAGRFDFNMVTAGAGTWSLLDDPVTGHFGNYEQQVVDKTIPALTKKGLVTDSSFIFIPQKTNPWLTAAGAAVTTSAADAGHQVYLVVYCQVYLKDGAGEWTQCVWGNPSASTDAEKYKPIYVPLKATWTRSSAVKAITFEMGEKTMFKADGTPWEQEGGDKITFSESLLLDPEPDENGYVDTWEENSEDNFKVTL